MCTFIVDCGIQVPMSLQEVSSDDNAGHDPTARMPLSMPVPSREQVAQWRATFPVTGAGVPTSIAAYNVIEWFFRHRGKTFLPNDLVEPLGLHVELVALMCIQLRTIDYIIRDVKDVERFRYNLNSSNSEFQGKTETVLLDGPRVVRELGYPNLPG